VPVVVSVTILVWVTVTVSLIVGGMGAAAARGATPPSTTNWALIRAWGPSLEGAADSSRGTFDSQPTADDKSTTATTKRSTLICPPGQVTWTETQELLAGSICFPTTTFQSKRQYNT
jgi:hypothetical protein